MYEKLCSGSKGFPPTLAFHITDHFGLDVTLRSDGDPGKAVDDPDKSNTVFAAAEEPCGPLINLLWRLNKSPSSELVKRAREADQDHEPYERVTVIDSSLKKILTDGEVPIAHNPRQQQSLGKLFHAFGTTARGSNPTEDDRKNMPDYDPDQESELYEYSSDARLELTDVFGFIEAAGPNKDL